LVQGRSEAKEAHYEARAAMSTPFTVQVMQGLNAIEYLERQAFDGYLSLDEIVDAIGAPKAMLARTMMLLAREGIVEARKGAKGGYRAGSLDCTVLDVMRCLGQEVLEPIGDRGSDRLNAALFDAVNVPLSEFLS
jgi:DNA-binding IscR family transcriptional regulator